MGGVAGNTRNLPVPYGQIEDVSQQDQPPIDRPGLGSAVQSCLTELDDIVLGDLVEVFAAEGGYQMDP